MCDCIKKIEQRLNDKMSEQNPGCKIIDKVRMENLCLIPATIIFFLPHREDICKGSV